MKSLNPFSFKAEQEMMDFDPENPFAKKSHADLDRVLKRVFFKKVAQMAIGFGIGLTIRAVLKNKWPEEFN